MKNIRLISKKNIIKKSFLLTFILIFMLSSFAYASELTPVFVNDGVNVELLNNIPVEVLPIQSDVVLLDDTVSIFSEYKTTAWFNKVMEYDNVIVIVSNSNDRLSAYGFNGEKINIALEKQNGSSIDYWTIPSKSVNGELNYQQNLKFVDNVFTGYDRTGYGNAYLPSYHKMYVLKGNILIGDKLIEDSQDNIIFPSFGDTLDKDRITNFDFGDYEAYFYSPSNGSTINLHYKDSYFWKFNARLYVKFDGDMFISDKKVMEMLISNLQISSPFELYNPVGTYVERPSLSNDFKAKAYIDFKIGFPSDFDFGDYVLEVSFPNSSTSQSPQIKSAKVKIRLTSDGSIQEGVVDKDGKYENITGSSGSSDSLPTAPSGDGSIGDWFNYIGSLITWIVTYPFQLLSDVFKTLTGYIHNMVSELSETSRAITGLFTFIPSDILNVTYGIISFTLVYSVIRGVLKLIRG